MKVSELVRKDRAMPEGASVTLEEGDYILEFVDMFSGESSSGNDKLVFVFESRYQVVKGNIEESPRARLFTNLIPFTDGEPNQVGFEILLNMVCTMADVSSWEDVLDRFDWDIEPGIIDAVIDDLEIYKAEQGVSEGALVKAYIKTEEYQGNPKNRISRWKYVTSTEANQINDQSDVPF